MIVPCEEIIGIAVQELHPPIEVIVVEPDEFDGVTPRPRAGVLQASCA